MKVLICYNDNDNKSIHKTLRITVPGSWRTKSAMADLLNQYVTSYNAYHRKQILSVENTHLATRQAPSPSDKMSFIGEEMIRTTTNTKQKKLFNITDNDEEEDDGLDHYCYVSFANDTKLVNTKIRDRAKLYVRHNLPILPSSSSSSNSITATKNFNVEYNNDNGVVDEERFEAEFTYRVVEDDECKEKSLIQEEREEPVEDDVETRNEVETARLPPLLSSSSHTVGMMRKTISSLIGIKKGSKTKEVSSSLQPVSPQRFANTMYGLNVDDNDTSNLYGKNTTTTFVPVSSAQPYCESAPTNYGDKLDEDSEEEHISPQIVDDEENKQMGADYDDDEDDDDAPDDDADDVDEFNNEIVYSIVDENIDKPWLQKLERTETRDEVEILPPILPTSMRKSLSLPSSAHGYNNSFNKKGSKTAKVSARALSPRRVMANNNNNNTTTSTPSRNMTVVPTTSAVVSSNKELGGNGNDIAIAPVATPINNVAATTATATAAVSATTVSVATVSAVAVSVATVSAATVSAATVSAATVSAATVSAATVSEVTVSAETAAAPVAVASNPLTIHRNTETSTNTLSNILGRALRPRSRSVSPRKTNRSSVELKATANDSLSSSLHNCHQTSISPPTVYGSSAAVKATANNSLSQSLHDDQKPMSSPMTYRSSAAEFDATASRNLSDSIVSDQKPLMMNNNTTAPKIEVTSKSVLTSKETNISINSALPTISKEMKKSRNVLSFLLRGRKKTKEVTEVPSFTYTYPQTQIKPQEIDAYAVTVNEGSHNQDKSENPTGIEISDNSLHTSSVIERYDGREFAAETEPNNTAPSFRRIDTLDSIGMGQSFGTAYSMEDLSRFKTYLKRTGVVEDGSMFDEMVHEMKVENGESNAAIKKKMQKALKESFRNAMIAMRTGSTDGAVALTRVSSPRGGIALDTILEEEKEPTTTTTMNPRKAPLIIDTADAATAPRKNTVYDDVNTIAGGTHLNRDIYVDSSGSLAGSSLVSPTQWIVPTPYPAVLSPPIGPIRNAVNNLCGAAEIFPRLTCKNGHADDVLSDDGKKFDFILVNNPDDQFSPADDETELRETMMFEQALPVPDTTAATGINGTTKFGGIDISQHSLVTGVRDFCTDAAAVATNTRAIIVKQTTMYQFLPMDGNTKWEEKFASKYDVCGCNLSMIREACRFS